MTAHRSLLMLTAVNCALLLYTVAGPRPVAADAGAGVLRGTALQIVDTEGRVRASLGILPRSVAADGTASEETVLLRLINAEGQPSVKIGVSPTAAGLSLVGGDDQSYIVVAADGPQSTVKLVGPQGKTTTLGP